MTWLDAWPDPSDDLGAPAESEQESAAVGWHRAYDVDGHAWGYRRAAEMLYEGMLASGLHTDRDSIFYPFALCWRHYVELRLKSLLTDLGRLAGQSRKDRTGHNLIHLGSAFEKECESAFPGQGEPARAVVCRTIQQLHGWDPTGVEFRYDTRRDGSKTLPEVSWVNLKVFHRSMSGVANYLEAAGMAIEEAYETKREMYDEGVVDW